MPKLPRLSGRELIKILEVFGFVVIRQKGSHIVLKKKTPTGEIGTVVPDHKELAEGTMRGILKQAGISMEDFLKEYSK
ncbi:MAG: type II toxin-antitoxin system HicA family toxin [Bacteroidetes bacterium]|nr:type II toxin-antitoxin system HicA family toxin [Bacteroidota bacterium]